jgi:hypothetical protein
MISGLVLKYLNMSGLVIRAGYKTTLPASSCFCLTVPPEVLKRLTCGREASAVSLYDLCFLSGEVWRVRAERTFSQAATQKT